MYVGLVEKAQLVESYDHNKRPIRYVAISIPYNIKVVDRDVRQSLDFWLKAVDGLYEIVDVPTPRTIIASKENPLSTPSAGAVSFFCDENGEVRYVAMAQKDAGAPRDPGFRVPRNGFPESERDWYTMEHLVREAYEEGIMLTRNYELILPDDGLGEHIVNERARILESQTPLRIAVTIRVPVKFVDGRDKITVVKGNDMYHSFLEDYGTVSWTPETGLNFVKAMEVRYPMEDVLLVDTETLPDGRIIGRDYCVTDLLHLQGKRFGDPVHETVHRIKDGSEFLPQVQVFGRDDVFLADKVSRSLLCQYEYHGQPVYPVDWLEESLEFLSRPEVQKAYGQGFAFSDLEKRLKTQN